MTELDRRLSVLSKQEAVNLTLLVIKYRILRRRKNKADKRRARTIRYQIKTRYNIRLED